MTLSLNALRENLIELKSLTPEQAKSAKKFLVANLSQTRVYNVAHGWGRFWRFIYKIRGKFACHVDRDALLIKTLLKVNDKFQEYTHFVESSWKVDEWIFKEVLEKKTE